MMECLRLLDNNNLENDRLESGVRTRGMSTPLETAGDRPSG